VFFAGKSTHDAPLYVMTDLPAPAVPLTASWAALHEHAEPCLSSTVSL